MLRRMNDRWKTSHALSLECKRIHCMKIHLTRLIAGICVTAALSLSLSAQAPQHCATDELHEDFLQAHPEARALQAQSEAAYRAYLGSNRSASATYTIPTVVHIIQLTPLETVSDARVQTQIDVLNEDFRKLNADAVDIPAVFQSVAADSDIEFCLAQIDPNGCPTTGINRIVSPYSEHFINQASTLKGLIQWDPYKYLNMWVVNSIDNGGILGYATFPTSLPTNPGLDGIVVWEEAFGRGEGTPFSSFDLGRTTTHEVGHWLGLFHTFQSGCGGNTATNCSFQGDMVCDTPPTSSPNYGCPNTQNTCTETPTDLPDQTVNFMDYGDDFCLLMFSEGQRDRMHFFLNSTRSNIHSVSNLAATGCDGSTSIGCNPTAAISADILNVCTGASITFSDASIGVPTSWSWTFPGGNPATSTQQNPTVSYGSPGVYNVTLQVTNSFGTATTTETAYVNVVESTLPPFTESFEGNLLYPQDWYGVDGDAGGTWKLTTAGASLGIYSLFIQNFGKSYNGTADDLVSLPIDLSNAGIATMTFDRAYRRFNSFARDTLQVQVSSDCGLTWTTEWEAFGLALATVGGLQVNGPFVPTATQWATDTIDLGPYVGNKNVRVRFRSIGAGGQDLYLDNVNMDAVVSASQPVLGLSAFSVVSPFEEEIEVRFSLARASDMDLALYSPAGQLLVEKNIGKMVSGEQQAIWRNPQIAALPAGIYFLRASSNGGSLTRKLIKLR